LGRAELSDGPAQAVIQVEVGNKGKREKERGEGPGAGPMCMGQRGHARSGRAHLPPATTIAYRENWRRTGCPEAYRRRSLAGSGRRRAQASGGASRSVQGASRACPAPSAAPAAAPPVRVTDGFFFSELPGQTTAAPATGNLEDAQGCVRARVIQGAEGNREEETRTTGRRPLRPSP
jgi:hypothetical protein